MHFERVVAARLSLCYSATGLGVALALVIAMGQVEVLAWSDVWLGAAACLVTASICGLLLGRGYSGFSGWLAMVAGVATAAVSLLSGVLVGSLPGLLGDGTLPNASRLFDYFVKPLYWIASFGWGPVVLLGSSCGLHVRFRLRATDDASVPGRRSDTV